MLGRVDFLHPRRQARLGQALLVLGSLALIGALAFDRMRAAQRAEAEIEAQAQAAQAHRRAVEARKPAVETRAQRHWRQIAPPLRQPWLPALRQVEAVTEAPIYLLALSFEPSTGRLRLDVEAPSFEQALTYAQDLGESGVLGPAELHSHEQVTDPNGRSVVRFTLSTPWRTR